MNSNRKFDNSISRIKFEKMELNGEVPEIPPLVSVGTCFILSVIYVASLYIWNSEHNRDHPSTIKKRFCSVFVVMLISPVFVYLFSSKTLWERTPLLEAMGFRRKGLLPAMIIPFLLTVLLFIGPISVQLVTSTSLKSYFNLRIWLNNLQNLLWLRNHIVAPLSEEFGFRACMMPLLLQSFTPMKAILINPLFFGVAHFHHIGERLKSGMELKNVIIISCFQFTYTTIFGFYSAYLFVKTGHFMAPFVAHAFCNHMGFPDIPELLQQQQFRRQIHIALYIIGFVGWIILTPIATNPAWFGNDIYWHR